MIEASTIPAVENLVLVRLLAPTKKGLRRRDLQGSLQPFFQHRGTVGEWNRLLDHALQSLAESGLISASPHRLTEPGQRQALQFLCLDALPPGLTWLALKNHYLVVRSLGIGALHPEARRRLATAEGLRGFVLKQHYDLATGAFPTLSQAANALLWKQLGVETSQGFTVNAVKSLLLSRLLDTDGKQKPGQLLNQLLVKSTGARNSGANELRLATIRKWLAGSLKEAGPGAAPAEAGEQAFNLAGFVEGVLEAARASERGRFGDRKVFISHVWHKLHEDGAFPGMAEDEFKRRLTEANQAGLLTLSRADLVEAMNPDDVKASETRYLTGTFHFVQT